jgi:hypothetical protein
MGKTYLFHIIQGIAGKCPLSLVPKQSDTLYKFIVAFPDNVRASLNEVMAEITTSRPLDDADKEAFAKGILG